MLALALIGVFSWMLIRRALQEDSPLLAVGLSYSLACLLLLALANLSLDGWPAWLVMALLLLPLSKKAAPKLAWPGFSRPTNVVLTLGALLVVVFTNLSNNLAPDDDFWIHFPLQGLLEQGGLPVRHPFFPEIVMNGHYGRDLLLAAISRHAGISPLHSLFWQTGLCQLASFLTVTGLIARSSRSQLCVVLGTFSIFFGVNVGGRGGLLDCFQNNNALAYMLTLGVLHLLYLVYSRSNACGIAVAGFALGTLAIVYETHFGLLGLTVLTGLAITRRKELAMVGALALLLAAVQGGPVSKLVKDRLSPPAPREWTPGELNQHQIIKLTFPKGELFQIQLAYGNYQRRSLVYDLLPDLGAVSAIAPGTPYRSILSWDVLKIHWLATLLAPLTLLILLRRRADPVALALWIFAAWAYLTPGLVHFGPIYEFEYYRWEFAAGFGFAGSWGIALGHALRGCGRLTVAAAISLYALLGLAPSLLVFPPRLYATAVQKGRWQDAVMPRSQARWVLAQHELLGGFDLIDLKAARQLERLGQPGQFVLANSPYRVPGDLHFDSTLSGLSGLRSVGHSLPWPQEPVGTPPFHRSAPARVFWLAPSAELLDQLEVDWLYLRRGPEHEGPLIRWLDQNLQPVWQDGHSRIYRRTRKGKATRLSGVASTPSQAVPPTVRYLATESRTSELLLFEAVPDGKTWAWGFVPAGDPPSAVDLHEVVTWRSGPAGLVTPPRPGDYELVFFEVRDGQLRPALPHLPFKVVETGSLVPGLEQR